MELSTDRRFHSLTREQVHTLDQVLTEIIPIHGRGNFPTLEVKPKDIIHVVRDRLVEREIKVRDVRLNGSTASHVLVKENGTGYKDLDVIFGVELPKQEDFQIIKEVVLDCLRDFLPPGVNRDKITALTMKEAYVQKMVKVFTEHDRWSLISLSNNRGKNVELKFVNSLRRQFEFSVDSFQIILDRMLESYLVAESRQAGERKTMDEAAASFPENGKPGPVEGLPSTHHQNLNDPQSHSSELPSEACHDKEVLMREEMLPCVSTLAEAVSMGDENMVKMKHRRHRDAELFAKAEPAATREEEAEVMGNVSPVPERGAVSSSFETQVRRVESFESIKLLNLETPAPSAYSLGPESTEALNQSMFVIKVSEFEEPELVRGSCESVAQCSTFPVHTEHPLPSPAKKTCKKSQMVVLKRSSPKPSRKMLKKVSSTADKTPIMSQVHVLSNQLLEPKVISSALPSPPMLNKEPPFSTNCSQLSTKNTQDKECPVHLLGVPVSVHAVSSQNKATEVKGLHTEQMCLESGESETLGKWALSQTTGSETGCGDQNPAHRTGTGTECGDQDPAQRAETETSCADQDPAHRTETGTECGDQDPAQRAGTGTECGDQDPAQRAERGTECVDQDPAHRTQTGTECVGQDPACRTEPGTGCGDREPVQTTETGTGCSDQDPARRTEPWTGCDDQEPSHSTEPETGCGSQGPETVAQRPIAVSGHQESQSGLKMKKSEVLAPELPLITVVAESMYGDFEEAMDHLRRRLIATRNPEEIRGGGLLKYSNLLVREFTPADDVEIKSLERYMCSRFFIDFPDVNEQQRKIESYLRNHFIGEETSKYDYLMTLRRVIDESTVCLMGHERRQTLNMITILALKVLGEQNAIPNTSNVTCFYQPAPYVTDCNFNNYYIAHGQPPLIYHPYPLHIHMQTGLV